MNSRDIDILEHIVRYCEEVNDTITERIPELHDFCTEKIRDCT